jgi:tRNA-2-methylthio-N6-dimethylallyladenosine synthase
MLKKYFIFTFGCQMNKSDSERIAAVLENIGYKPVSVDLSADSPAEARRPKAEALAKADLVVVNMCSVRQSAVDRINGLILNLKKLATRNPFLTTILTGCILEKDKRKFVKHFDYILDIKDLSVLKSKLKTQKLKLPRTSCFATLRGRQGKSQNLLNLKTKSTNYFKIEPKYSNGGLAYMPIMTGCNNFCSFCVVPYTRGREISRPVKEILKETRKLIKNGYKEICLLGQNVNSYHSSYSLIRTNKRIRRNQKKSQRSPISLKKTNFIEVKINFPKLLRLIEQIPGDFKISFMTLHPKDFSDELIETIAASKKLKKKFICLSSRETTRF